MSPPCQSPDSAEVRFPRVSGDEPFQAEDAPDRASFSPRERG